MVQFGINLNPRHPVGQPSNIQDLQGTKWARIVFQAASARETIDKAYAVYDPLIDRYNSIGMRTIMVLNQETFWGHGPWDNGDWDRYAREFAAAIAPIVARYRGKGVAYEIWNEGDIRGHSSIYVPPGEFAKVLQIVYQTVKSNDPDAPVVLGGLAAGVGDAVVYVKEIRNSLGGKLPVDAIGIHPYGQWTPNFSGNPGWGGWFGQMTDYIRHFINSFPNIPLWMTEIGVSEEVNFPPEQYPMVSKYMQGVYDLMNQKYPKNVPVVIWFAWSDIMRQAGIVDSNNTPKTGLYNKYIELSRQSSDAPILPGSVVSVSEPKGIILAPISQLWLRSGPGTGHDKKSLLQADERLVAIETPAKALSKVGENDQWINVQQAGGTEGWTAAWYLKLVGVIIETNAAGGLNIRSGPGVQNDKVGLAQPGDNLVVLGDVEEAIGKIGVNNEWINIRLPDGTEGWAAAWYIEPLAGSIK